MFLRGLLAWSLVMAACSQGTGGGATTQGTPPAGIPTSVWSPPSGTSWQWQLSGTIDTSFDVDMYDIDLFEAPVDIIDRLHEDGRVVVCYFSAGSFEEWRPDVDRFPDEVIGAPLDGWPGERWLDVRADGLKPILLARLDLAAKRGCDAVEPDNVDAFTNESGFPLSASDQLSFNRWLAGAAHDRGLSVGLKNDLVQASDLVDSFDWMLVEECAEFGECAGVEAFFEAGKAVFGAEYGEPSAGACAAAAEWGISLLFKDLDLTAPQRTCG